MDKRFIVVVAVLLVLISLSWNNAHAIAVSSSGSPSFFDHLLRALFKSTPVSSSSGGDSVSTQDLIDSKGTEYRVLGTGDSGSGYKAQSAGSFGPLGSTNGGIADECQNDEDCEPPTPACQTLYNPNRCVECNQDLHCTDPAKPACKSLDEICVECTGDEHCSAPTPACNTITYKCIECTQDSHCTDPAKPACDFFSKTCVECTGDEHCSVPTPACDKFDDICVECEDDFHCTDPAKPACHPFQDICVECNSHDDCESPTPFCSDNRCMASPSCIDSIDGGAYIAIFGKTYFNTEVHVDYCHGDPKGEGTSRIMEGACPWGSHAPMQVYDVPCDGDDYCIEGRCVPPILNCDPESGAGC